MDAAQLWSFIIAAWAFVSDLNREGNFCNALYTDLVVTRSACPFDTLCVAHTSQTQSSAEMYLGCFPSEQPPELSLVPFPSAKPQVQALQY